MLALKYTGKTSCEIGVKVTAFDPVTGERHHTASAYLTFVALNNCYGRPTDIPPVEPQTADEKRRFQEGQARRKSRLELKAALASRRHGTAP